MKIPWRGRWQDYTSRILVWSLCLAAVCLSLVPLAKDHYRAYQAAQAGVNQIVQPGEAIMGPQTYWLGLYDHRYLRWEYLLMYPRLYPGNTLADALEKYRPDIFIVDSYIRARMADRPVSNVEVNTNYFLLPETELRSYLAQHARLVASFDNEDYGPIQVYRLSWSKYASTP